jgi:MoxR-vWA-beta-propeller ternary system domain bpX5
MSTPSWLPREPPLVPHAVLGRGPSVAGLADRASVRLAAGARLRVAAAPGWLVVLGDAGDLPWSPGVRYLGWDCGALLPTTLAVSPSAELLVRALRRRVPAGDDLVVVVGSDVLSSVLPTRPASPGQLAGLRGAS